MSVSISTVSKAALPVVVLAGGIFAARTLIATKPAPPKKPREERAVLVETETVHPTSRDVIVRASGTVVPAYEVALAAEVGGRVVWKHPQLTTGGLLRKGEVLLRIDQRDHELALEQRAAALERARTELQLEEGRQRVAAAEWQRFGDEQADASKALALREPQKRAAELALKTADQALAQARLQLGRTVIKAPFDAVVRDNSTEEGRLVTPGQTLATLVDTTLFMVAVSVSLDDLAWLKVPGVGAPLLTDKAVERAWAAEDPRAALAGISSLARIRQSVGEEAVEREGIIVRLLGDLDPAGHMARLLVGVRDPMGRDRKDPAEGVAALPILLGAYVNVQLVGKHVDGVIEVPRLALREGDSVYLMSAERTLESRAVDILWRGEDTVLLRSGLAPGDRLVTSPLASPVVGMELKTAEDDAEQAPPRAEVEGAARQPQEVRE